MAESFTSVRLLQHHLRQAGMLLSTGQLDGAAKHLDAAFEIDPASLAALTLGERLQALRASSGRPAADYGLRANAPVPDPPTEVPQSSAGRFVPSGVDAASWTDFEQRVQQRRFRALIEAGDRAAGAGDLAGARAALEEARELQPESLEVSRLSIRVATIPMVAADAVQREGLFRSRTFRAASLLLVGVSLLMGLDWVRSEQPVTPTSTPAPIGTGGRSADEVTAASEEPAPSSGPAVEASTEFAAYFAAAEQARAVPVVAPDPSLSTVPDPLPVRSQPRPQRELAPGEVPDDFVTGFSPSLPRELTLSPSRSGEIPDDYVAQSRRDPVQSVAGGRAATPSPIANVVRQPPLVETLATSPAVGVTTSPIVAPAPVAPAAAAGAAIVTSNDKARVESVLHQYARAYGQLDARAVRAVYPSVDERALAKAFSDLNSQTVSFECDVNIEPSGASAKASCHGTARYVRKVGSQEPRTEPRTVQFELKRDGEAWRIQKAQTGR